MKIQSSCIADGQPIPAENAFCVADPAHHVTLGRNLNPDISWSGLPAGTRSLVLICHDPDVPSRPDDVNKEGRTVSASLPRVHFYHWVLVDLDPAAGRVGKGEFSDGVTARGKSGAEGPRGARQGINDYTAWFKGDPNMDGQYFGYDGPCPPWNDEIPHRYVFTLYALDIERCPVEGAFSGADVQKAIEGRVLAKAAVTGRYTLNPRVRL